MFSHAQIWEIIDSLAEQSNCSISALAIKAGLSSTCLNPSKRYTKSGKERWPSTETFIKIINASTVDQSFFEKFMKNQQTNS